MQDPNVLLWLAVFVHVVVAVVVVVAAAAAVWGGGRLFCPAADRGGSGLKPRPPPAAAGDRELGFGAGGGAWSSLAALHGNRAAGGRGGRLDGRFPLGLLGGAGEQDQVVFGLRDLADVWLWLAGAHGLQLSD